MAEYRCMICQKLLTDDDKSDAVNNIASSWAIQLWTSIKKLLKHIADECREEDGPINVSHSPFSYLTDRSLIKDCPFCGEPGILLHNTINNSINLIGCETNGCICCINNKTGMVFKTRGNALDAWNKRS